MVDLEVQNHPYYGQVASSFHPDNYIVAPGWRVDTVNDDGSVTVGETHTRYFNSKAESEAGSDWFDAVDDCSLMVAHNAAFEIKWFISSYRDKFESFIKRGGRVLCTAMGHYLLSHQQDLYPALGEIAPSYGAGHKVDGVKILWEQGALTADIDKDLLLEYLGGPSGDIDNTATVFYSQMGQLAAANMVSMFYERCDSILAFAYCEWFGLHVDMDLSLIHI